MDIMDIEIVSLTDQYLSYINNMEKLNLNIASEYLTIASELIYLKSKILLPNNKEESDNEEFIEAKENLINRLLEYKQYKDITNTFKILEEQRGEFFTKSPSNLKEYKSNEIVLNENITLEDLVKAFQKFLERKEYNKPITTKITTKEISVSERRNYIKNILKERKKVEFFWIYLKILQSHM